jgi:hypothetical protein
LVIRVCLEYLKIQVFFLACFLSFTLSSTSWSSQLGVNCSSSSCIYWNFFSATFFQVHPGPFSILHPKLQNLFSVPTPRVLLYCMISQSETMSFAAKNKKYKNALHVKKHFFPFLCFKNVLGKKCKLEPCSTIHLLLL